MYRKRYVCMTKCMAFYFRKIKVAQFKLNDLTFMSDISKILCMCDKMYLLLLTLLLQQRFIMNTFVKAKLLNKETIQKLSNDLKKRERRKEKKKKGKNCTCVLQNCDFKVIKKQKYT